MPTRVLIVDDHPVVREGLAMRIGHEPDLEVCGEAADAADALALLETACPEVIIVDVHLKSGDGLDLIKRIKARDPSARILVWSMYPDSVYAERVLRAGALGYINKAQTTGRLIDAIRRVRDGKIYLSEEAAERVLSQAAGGPKPPATSPVQSLSDRELEVFRLIGEGLATSQIAQRMHLSFHTIETHRQRIKQKLNVESAAELLLAATKWTLGKG